MVKKILVNSKFSYIKMCILDKLQIQKFLISLR